MLSLTLYLLAAFHLAQGRPSGDLVLRTTISDTRTLSVPNSPPKDTQVVDANFQSYSIEFAYMLDYAGNKSHPNEFSIQLLRNLYDISGAYPIIRAGGATSSIAEFVADQNEALIAKFNSPTSDRPSKVSIGPTWVESFQQFPETKYIYGLNFNDGNAGLAQAVLEATNAYAGLGNSLYAFEIGNEVDGYACHQRSCSWTIETYVPQWKQYAAAIAQGAIGSSDSKVEPIFQACVFQAPRHLGTRNPPYWTVENALKLDIAGTGKVRTVADHDYVGSDCPGASVPTIQKTLLNHFRMTGYMYYHEVLGNYASSVGVPYVLGETNSVECQGKAGVSDVYAAALWSVDYTLYVASLKVSRMHYHMGTRYRYSPWQPVTYNGVGRHVKPLYYGNLFAATALAGGDKQVSVLINETSFTAYGIYNSKSSSIGSVAIVNLEIWNSTQSAKDRPYTAVKLPVSFAKAQVKRLTSPGVEIATDITFAGQHVDDNGNIAGTQDIEIVANGEVLVAAGEAVLVSL